MNESIFGRLIKHQDESNTYSLSYGQEALWAFCQLAPKSATCNLMCSALILKPLNKQSLKKAFQEIIERHASLRTTYLIANGKAVQKVHEKLPFFISEIDISKLNKEQIKSYVNKLSDTPFELERNSLFRVHLLTRSENEHLILITAHSIAADLWSLEVLMRDLLVLYVAKEKKIDTLQVLPPLKFQYLDYKRWQENMINSTRGKIQRSYWEKVLSENLPKLDLPLDRPHPMIPTYYSSSYTLQLSNKLTHQLKNLAWDEGVPLFVVILSAFQALLHRYTGQEEIITGVPAIGRGKAEFKEVIGYFTNLLALRQDFTENSTFLEKVNQVHHKVSEALNHQDYPYLLLAKQLSSLQESSLFSKIQVMFSLINPRKLGNFISPLSFQKGIIDFGQVEIGYRGTPYDLDLKIFDLKKQLKCSWHYNKDIFNGSTIERMADHFKNLLEGIVNNPQSRISDLPLLTELERNQMLLKWNNTEMTYPEDKCIHQLFEEQIEKTPDGMAVSFKDNKLTFRDLNNRANQLAHYLRTQGVNVETKVGLCLERSLEMVVGILAILKAGGAFVPLDPNYPKSRLDYIQEDSQIFIVLTQKKYLSSLNRQKSNLICLDSDWDIISQENRENLQLSVSPENLAYVIYTSGSKAKPKGVLGLHRNILNRLFWSWQKFPFDSNDIACQKTALSFIDSVSEIFGPLLQGVPLLIIPDEAIKDPFQLVKILGINRITRIVLVPTLLRAILDNIPDLQLKLPKLKIWVSSGEKLPIELYQQFRKIMHSSKLLNFYGSTEVTADASWYDTTKCFSTSSVPIGRPIGNTQLYVLDKYLQLVPVGVSGELYVGGAGLARGYINNPVLTSERFIPSPFSNKPGSRLYKTGDLARFAPDGNIEYLGRIDDQVKIRGYRIELGEIETTLRENQAIQDVFIMAREGEITGKNIVAYIVIKKSLCISPEKLRNYLKMKLPEFMIPSYFIYLDTIPLLPNGKVDQRSLPKPERDNLGNGYVAPRDYTEEFISSIMVDILDLKKVGVNDNFFKLGGDSLTATQVIYRLNERFAVEIPMHEFFDCPNIAELAKIVKKAKHEQVSVKAHELRSVSRKLFKVKVSPLGELSLISDEKPKKKNSSEYAERREVYISPMSYAQKRVWCTDHISVNNSETIHIEGPICSKILVQSFNEILNRHESLRTTFALLNGCPVQLITPILDITIPVVDLRQLTGSEKIAEVHRLAIKERMHSFDLFNDKLIRVFLLILNKDEHVLLLTLDHIISDGWSIEILLRELAVLYESFIKDEQYSLPEMLINYSDFTHWQLELLSDDRLDKLTNYWRKQLKSAPRNIEFKYKENRTLIRSFEGRIKPFYINETQKQMLMNISHDIDATLFMTLITIYAILISHYSGKDDIVIGSPIANRMHNNTESLIGNFVNTILLRIDLSGNPTFKRLLKRVRKVALNAYDNQDMPFEHLVRSLEPDVDIVNYPLYQVSFALHNVPRSVPKISGLTFNSIQINRVIETYNLSLEFVKTEKGIEGALIYNIDLFNTSFIDQMLKKYQKIMTLILTEPNQNISKLLELNTNEL